MSNWRSSSAWDSEHADRGQAWRRWGGRVGSVTQAIVWGSIAVFGVQFVAMLAGSYWPSTWFGLSQSGLGQGRLWQPVSYMFLHEPRSLFHILFNLLMLWFLGREVEYFIGPKPYLGLYLLSGLVGGLFWLLFNPWGVLIGASAAVLGCLVAFATLFPNRELTLLVFFVLPVQLKAKYLAIGAVVLEILFELSNSQSGVAHLAHLGGAAVGYVYIKAMGFGSHPRWVLWLQALGEWLGRLKGRSRNRGRLRDSQSVEDYLREEIDPILDKISREGMHSLTRRERKILESARDLMEKHRR